jgi:hypothetical protein
MAQPGSDGSRLVVDAAKTGFSAGASYYGGADFSWGTDSQGRPVYVGELSAGAGFEDLPAAEVHGGVSETWSASFSIPKVWDWLTSLFG